ncbi:MAG: di-trans,poly-cis-decaprenylcistransferase [Wolinella sp.]
MNELKHLAIIMDGNGRWANLRGKTRIKGHEVGAERLRDITVFCSKNGIEFLTLYAFSTENWKRPKAEVDFLMKLLGEYLKKEAEIYIKNNIRFRAIGNLERFSPALLRAIVELEERSARCSGLTQILALNYGSQDEIVRAVKKMNVSGLYPSVENLERFLDTAFVPSVDMLVRTGGEMRLSNFLLWQASYAELFFTQTLWPDFTSSELGEMIEEFGRRKRRFGGI